MVNKSIKSRYSIEYAYPDSSNKKKSNKKWPLIIAGLLSAGVLSSAIIPFKSVEAFITSTFHSIPSRQSTQATLTGIVDTNEQQQEEVIELVEDKPQTIRKDELTKVLNELDSDFLVEVSNSNTPNIDEIEVAESEKVVEVIEINVEKLLLDNKKQQEASQKQLIANKKLTEKLNELTRQLTAEKEKNEKLSTQINAHESNASKLTSLLNNALSNASNDDQKYLAELNNLGNNNSPLKTVNKTKKNDSSENLDITAAINNQVAQLMPTTSSVKVDYNNSISVSTAAQVDAIVLAMQEIQQGTINRAESKTNKNTVLVETTKVTNSETTEKLLYIELQKQINQMLAVNEEKSSNYKEALKKESTVRKNAMRSITVKEGETLWSIAKRAYGNGSLYTKIIEANPHIAKDGKVVLSIGQVIRVPI